MSYLIFSLNPSCTIRKSTVLESAFSVSKCRNELYLFNVQSTTIPKHCRAHTTQTWACSGKGRQRESGETCYWSVSALAGLKIRVTFPALRKQLKTLSRPYPSMDALYGYHLRRMRLGLQSLNLEETATTSQHCDAERSSNNRRT